ncbi:MAG: hypothetical protein CM15mP103_12050 [Gammaproteobacteria bacterium]|nr:MAG: hypothetical protein CM15mP103_12050 [Gammaproteobacteria bacterium]
MGVPADVARRLIPGNTYKLVLKGERFTAELRSIRDDLDPTTLTVGAVFDLPESTAVAVGESAVLQIAETVDSAGGWLPISALLEAPRGLWDVLTITLDAQGKQRAQRESVEILYTAATRSLCAAPSQARWPWWPRACTHQPRGSGRAHLR